MYGSFTDLLPLLTFVFFFIILVYRLFRVISKIYTNNCSNEVLSPWRKKLKHITEIKEDLTSLKDLFLAMLNFIVIIRSKLDPVFIWVLSYIGDNHYLYDPIDGLLHLNSALLGRTEELMVGVPIPILWIAIIFANYITAHSYVNVGYFVF